MMSIVFHKLLSKRIHGTRKETRRSRMLNVNDIADFFISLGNAENEDGQLLLF